jgi:3-oxoacyl-[acyl-carrier protein] reductase
MNLKDKIVLITGGNSGLGKATAILLKKAGAKVIISGRDFMKTDRVAEEHGFISIDCDVTSDFEINRLFEKIEKDFGRLDVLVNNAGIGKRFSLDEITREEMQKVYEVNVFGATMMAKHAARLMRKNGGGDIINIASTASLKGYPTGSIYASSKFALRGLTQCWQAELRRDDIRVILVNPSEVPTAFGREDREEKPLEDGKLTPQEIAYTIKSVIEMDDRGYIPEVTVHATNPF